MAYQTLYRKYRPKTFELVYGQDVIVKTLKNIIKNKKISHAYLFTGPRGTGKTSCAKLFAKVINCINNENGDACNECEHCKLFNSNKNPDIIEIDAASNNGVDEIREIKNKITLVPSMSKYKVYIIDEVHMLSIGAFNALLKTLEEPPEYIIFILATTEPQKIPSTIISRCQRFDFKNISFDKMKKCLENIVLKENISITDEALNEIIYNSKGGMRDAIGMLDQAFAFCDSKIELSDIDELSGNISNKEMNVFVEKILNQDYEGVIGKVEEYNEQGKDFYLIGEKIFNLVQNRIIEIKTKKNLYDSNNNPLYSLNDTKLYLISNMLEQMLLSLKETYSKKITFEIKLIQIIDTIGKCINNVSRETLTDFSEINTKVKNNDVPRGTSENKFKKNNNNGVERVKIEESYEENTIKSKDVPCETSENCNNEKVEEIKKIRINNILLNSTKQEIEFINNKWLNIKEYLIEENYKSCAGIMCNFKPVAASPKGVIITSPTESLLKKIEQEYDVSKNLLQEVYGKKYKIVYITDEYWKKNRPIYVDQIKNKQLKYIDESSYLEQIKKSNLNNSFSEFNELIEMEEK